MLHTQTHNHPHTHTHTPREKHTDRQKRGSNRPSHFRHLITLCTHTHTLTAKTHTQAHLITISLGISKVNCHAPSASFTPTNHFSLYWAPQKKCAAFSFSFWFQYEVGSGFSHPLDLFKKKNFFFGTLPFWPCIWFVGQLLWQGRKMPTDKPPFHTPIASAYYLLVMPA